MPVSTSPAGSYLAMIDAGPGYEMVDELERSRRFRPVENALAGAEHHRERHQDEPVD